MRTPHHLRLLSVAAGLSLLACQDDPVSTGVGELEVTTLTTGPAGTDAYAIRLDAEAARPVGLSASLLLSDLVSGEHRILLDGLPGHCTVTGDNPRMVVVPSGATARIRFSVTCVPNAAVLVGTRTTGESRDPNGYVLTVSDGTSRRVGIEAETPVAGLLPGAYTVTLTDVAPNCTVGNGVTREVAVASGSSHTVSFDVACTFIGAVRWDTIPLPAGVTSSFAAGKSLWGSSPSNLFVIGQDDGFPSTGAAILHYDGARWTRQADFPGVALVAITGSSATEAFAIGRHWNGIAYAGVILRYDGSRWSEMEGPVADRERVRYTDIWRAASGEILLLGTLDGTDVLARLDGSAWSLESVAGLGVDRPNAASGTSATAVWAISWDWNCDECTSITSFIGRWDGDRAAIVHQQMYSWYTRILAIAPDDVWVVGANDGSSGDARVVHWDGAAWTERAPVSDNPYLPVLRDLWASGSADLYAVGREVLLRFDGSTWREIPGLGGHVVWGTSRDDVFLLYRDNEVDRDFMIHGRP